MEIRLSCYEIACIWVDFQYRAYIPQEDFVHYDRGTDARASFVAFGYQNKFETWLVIMVLTAEIQSSSTFKHCKYCVYRFVARILIVSIKNILVIVFHSSLSFSNKVVFLPEVCVSSGTPRGNWKIAISSFHFLPENIGRIILFSIGCSESVVWNNQL